MEIILLKEIDKVGGKHEIVTVKNGYGRNYLIPQKKAVIANATNRARLDDMKQKEADREAKVIAQIQSITDSLEGKVLKIGAKAGTSGKIFGSVTNVQIANALKEQLDIEVERKKIEIPEEVKTLGTYTAILHLHKKVESKVTFEVIGE